MAQWHRTDHNVPGGHSILLKRNECVPQSCIQILIENSSFAPWHFTTCRLLDKLFRSEIDGCQTSTSEVPKTIADNRLRLLKETLCLPVHLSQRVSSNSNTHHHHLLRQSLASSSMCLLAQANTLSCIGPFKGFIGPYRTIN